MPNNEGIVRFAATLGFPVSDTHSKAAWTNRWQQVNFAGRYRQSRERCFR
jgi:hypothetical protein